MRFWLIEKNLKKRFFVFSIILIIVTAFASNQSKSESEKYVEMSKGKPNAPIIFVEYASLTCSHCAAFHTSVFPELNRDYIEKGLLRFVHREVYFDKAGLWASLTARCTNAVNRYFGMLDLLYSEQASWSRFESSDEIVERLLKISAKSGIDKGKAIACLEDQEKALSLVEKMKINVKKDDIESTPTFVINGKKYSNRPYEELKDIIEKELRKQGL